MEVKMLSQIPIDLEKVDKKDIDREILRASVIAELDAINLYEQMANLTENQILKKVLLEVAREEKTHVGEFQSLLLEADKEQEKELAKGKAEVDEMKEE
jgi:rubrerythrin